MSMLDLFSRLNSQGIRLQIVDDNLKINAPKGSLTESLVKELKDRKQEIIEFLRNHVDRQEKYASIQPAEKREIYPLSSSQGRMFILQQMETGNVSYNIPSAVVLDGDLDEQRFSGAFKRLIARHETLRTSFHIIGSKPVQRIHEPGDIDFAVESYGDWAERTPDEVFALVRSFVRPFDLARAPLLRVGLIQTADKRYVVMFDMHHIISDGTSMSTFLREFMFIYPGSELPCLPLQYRDFAVWQYNRSAAGKFKKQEAYWLSRFADELPVLNMHTDFARPPIQSFAGDHFTFMLEKARIETLDSLLEKAGATLFMLLLAVFNVTLSKYTGQECIVIGATIAGRSHADLQDIIGLFIEDLALRNDPHGELTFAEFLRQVKQNTLAAYENQDYPFKELIKRLGVENEVSRNPVFDVMLIVQNFAVQQFALKDITLSIYQAPGEQTNDTAKLDLTIDALESAEGIRFSLEYCTALYRRETMERFSRHFINIFEAVVRQPGIKLSEIAVIDEAERKRLLVEFNNSKPETGISDGKSLTRRFRDQVEKTPANTALAGKYGGADARLTYSELNKEADRLADILLAKGVQVDDIVGVLLPSSLEMVIGLWGILKSGGAYLPIEPHYPQERIDYLLADSGARFLVTLRSVSDRDWNINNRHIDVVFIDDAGAIDRSPETSCSSDSTADLAYVIYTSGTTGRPKGVLVEHKNLAAYIAAFENEFVLGPTDTVLQQVSYAFDAFVEEFYPIQVKGGKLAIPAREVIRDINALCDFIARHEATLITCSPQLLNELDKVAAGFAGKPGNPLSSLRILISGGDRLKAEYIKNLLHIGAVYNTYGPTESTVCATYYPCFPDVELADNVPIGKPIAGYRVYIRDRNGDLSPIGVPGELCAAGPGVTRGYLNKPELTAEKFASGGQVAFLKNRPLHPQKTLENSCADHFSPFTIHHSPFTTHLYKTGDLARWLPDGNIEFLGRIDRQVKIRGYRIELAEIERQLLSLENIKEAVVTAGEKKSGQDFLAAYVVCTKPLDQAAIKSSLALRLPDYMIPSYIMETAEIPRTPSGKLDNKKLPRPEAAPAKVYAAPGSKYEKIIAAIWQEALELERIGLDDNFFDLGGTSIDIFKVSARVNEEFAGKVPVVAMFQYTTVRTLARFLEADRREQGIPGAKQAELAEAVDLARQTVKQRTALDMTDANRETPGTGLEIAIIGMAGIFPGSSNLDEFWNHLKNGIETIAFFSDEEMLAEGIPAETLQNPNYIKARGIIAEAEYFDNAFFGYTPMEAQLMDPQMRIFTHCIWHALEDAGYDPFSYPRRIGLFAGASPNLQWEAFTTFSAGARGLSGFMTAQLADKDFLCTHISYKLNLNGPSLAIQTACSTSLAAIHLAAQSLLHGECDMALAGGVTVNYPPRRGYLYQESMIFAADGHNRTFDAGAVGSVFGDGAGVVLLKRLAPALADRDNIYAVLKGSAINNDGLRKVGYTAPSIDGQAEAIHAAMALAGVSPESITYIEAHGTATPLGDTVEIEALKKAFHTDKKGFCAIGTIKSNMGHLYSAAGAAGFIKTVLALKNRLIPPSLHFFKPNPQIDFANSPFYVVAEPTEWQTATSGNPPIEQPRRAGVSAFGIGGTNAHAILEEAPGQLKGTPAENSRQLKLLLLSAKSGYTLNQISENVIRYLAQHPQVDFADVAYTLQVGRCHFPYRRMVVLPPIDLTQDAEKVSMAARRTQIVLASEKNRPVYFMICGQGSQYVDMGIDLYRTEPAFREEIDRCFDILEPLMGIDLKRVLYPAPGGQGGFFEKSPPCTPQKTFVDGEVDINQTEITQPVLFAFEYALAKLLMSWGVKPTAMIGYSFGEYVAAALAGVFSLEDALKLVIARGKLAQQTPAGAMISAPLPEKDLRPLLPENLYLAIVNGPTCIVSGARDSVDAFTQKMKEKRIICVPVNMAQAIHSPIMESIRSEYESRVKEITLNKPTIPYISNVTANWITPEEAVNPGYWGDHLCSTVRFSDGLKELLKEENAIFMEIGPGRILGMMVRVHPDKKPGHLILNTVKHPQEKVSDDYFLLDKLGQLWLHGQEIDWRGFYGAEKRRRISLPGYPFVGKRYWLDINAFTGSSGLPAMPDLLQATPGAGAEPAPGETGFPGGTGEVDKNFAAPRDELEKMIAGLWREQMGLDRVGIHDDFFFLNGSSLVATQIIARLQHEYEVEIPISLFYEEPTIAHLAEIIREASKLKNKDIQNP